MTAYVAGVNLLDLQMLIGGHPIFTGQLWTRAGMGLVGLLGEP